MSLSPYSKPYLTIEEQIKLLKRRGMVFPDEKKAKNYLQTIAYYRLSPYWYPFRDKNKAVEILHNCSFQTVLDIYIFDKKMRLLVLDAIERIETALRNRVVLQVGKISPFIHRDSNYMQFPPNCTGTKRKNNFSSWLDILNKNEERSKDEFIKHFGRTYSGNMPLWISIETWSFTDLSIFFEHLNEWDMKEIASQFGIINKPTHLVSWLKSISFVRNICAHHSRLWNRYVPIPPRLDGCDFYPDLQQLTTRTDQQNSRLYAVLCVLRFLLRSVSPHSTWHLRVKDHAKTFPQNGATSLRSAGFPKGWENHPPWQ